MTQNNFSKEALLKSDEEAPCNVVLRQGMGQLAEALAKAQAKIKPPKKGHTVDYKDKNGRTIKYSYADLADCFEAAKPLSEFGISIIQTVGVSGGNGFALTTMLVHSSGEFVESVYPLPNPLQMRPQEFGSHMTYARRYALSSIVGFASEDDDDGAVASQKSAPSPIKKKITPAQLKRLIAIKSQTEWTDSQVSSLIKAETGLAKAGEMNQDQYDRVVDIIQRHDPEGYLASTVDES